MPSTKLTTPRLISIQTGKVTALAIRRGPDDQAKVMSGICKRPVSTLETPTRIALGRLGLAGDEQSDLSAHGGLDKAVYAYPVEHYAFWEKRLEQAGPLAPGTFGENLTTFGLLESDLWLGDELHFSACILAVESPRRPCYKLNAVLGADTAGKIMLAHQLTGWYMSVVQAGTIYAGEPIRIVQGPRRIALSERQRQITRPVDLR